MSKDKIPPHYSHSKKVGNLIFTSGQLPLISRDPLVVPSTIEEQTNLVLQKVTDLMKLYGGGKENIVKTTAFITNGDDWDAVNAVYGEFFGKLKPVRSVIPVPDLHFGCKIELEAIGHIEDDK